MQLLYAIGIEPGSARSGQFEPGSAFERDGSAMGGIETAVEAAGQGLPQPERRRSDDLPPSVAVRCGAAEAAAIIELLEQLSTARDAVEAWDGVTRDHRLRARQKVARLLADLFQRYPEVVLEGLRSPHAHTRIWVALSIAEAPSPKAIPALEAALAAEDVELDRRALAKALQACRAELAGGGARC
jgi:hypothetical protein